MELGDSRDRDQRNDQTTGFALPRVRPFGDESLASLITCGTQVDDYAVPRPSPVCANLAPPFLPPVANEKSWIADGVIMAAIRVTLPEFRYTIRVTTCQQDGTRNWIVPGRESGVRFPQWRECCRKKLLNNAIKVLGDLSPLNNMTFYMSSL